MSRYTLAMVLLLLCLPSRHTRAQQPVNPPPNPENWKPAGSLIPPQSSDKEDKSDKDSLLFERGGLTLALHGRVQAMFGVVGKDANINNGDVLSRDGFRVRRARLGATGQVSQHWLYGFELDLIDEDSGGNALLEAFIQYHPANFAWVKAGAYRPPFSRVTMVSSGQTQFLERPLWVNQERATKAHMLDLDRQVGLSAGGQASLFSYEVGVFNGSGGFSTGDLNNGLLYALRLAVGSPDMGPAESDRSRGGLRWQVGLNGYISHDAAADYRGAGTDLGLKVAGLSFYAEAVWAKGVPLDATEDVTSLLDESERWGMVAQLGYMLPISLVDIELAVRFALMDDQVHIEDEGDSWELTAGINAFLYEDFVKLMINYIHREEQHGAALENDLVACILQLRF